MDEEHSKSSGVQSVKEEELVRGLSAKFEHVEPEKKDFSKDEKEGDGDEQDVYSQLERASNRL